MAMHSVRQCLTTRQHQPPGSIVGALRSAIETCKPGCLGIITTQWCTALHPNSKGDNKNTMRGSALVGEGLQLVGGQGVGVVQHVVVRGAAGALDARVAVQVEVVLHRVHDRAVHDGAWPGRDMAPFDDLHNVACSNLGTSLEGPAR